MVTAAKGSSYRTAKQADIDAEHEAGTVVVEMDKAGKQVEKTTLNDSSQTSGILL